MRLHPNDGGKPQALVQLIGRAAATECIFASSNGKMSLAELAGSIPERLEQLSGRSVIVSSRDQLVISSALLALDGLARRITLCPADLTADQLSSVIATAGGDALVSEDTETRTAGIGQVRVKCLSKTQPQSAQPFSGRTEWILLTSGTTSTPKLVLHNLETLTAAFRRLQKQAGKVVWGTFYDISRYGGLQIFLRTVLTPASFVLAGPTETITDYLVRLATAGTTHILGTPTHWRRAIMSPLARELSPQYVRLSGEVVDQAILTALQAIYPHATIAHAFASTEAGVAFEVKDRVAGFPADFLKSDQGGVRLKVTDGSLHISSSGNALGYLDNDQPIRDREGFVDTGDAVELRTGRYYFLGRKSGVINVGGLKVHPEEVESVINRHPKVRMSRVRPRKSSVMGSILVADVVLRDEFTSGNTELYSTIKSEIVESCRAALARHKVPTAVNFVGSLAVGPTGKLVRDIGI